MVSKEKYREMLGHLEEAVHLNHLEMWAAKDCLHLRDSAPAHQLYCLLLVQQQLTKHVTLVLLHIPQSCSVQFFFTSFHG
jgi:hypothetical protein